MKLLLIVFWRGTARVRFALVLSVIVTLALSTMWVIEPLYARFAVDTMLTAVDGADVDFLRIFLWWFALYLCVNVINALRFYLRWHVLNHLLADTRQTYYEHVLRLDIAHHVKARGGELMKTIDNAADSVVDLAIQIIMELTPAVITAIAFYIISFFISVKLALISLAMIPLYLLTVGFSVWYTKKNIDKVNRLWVEALGRGYDSLGNIFTVKSSAAEERELLRMKATHDRGIRELKKANIVWAMLEGLNYFMLMRIVLISVGFWLLIRGELSLGSLFFFQFSFFRLVTPVEMVSSMMPRWNEMIGKIRLAEDLYAKQMHVKNDPNARLLTSPRGDIAFENVSFSYGKLDAVSDVSLSVKAGEHIAFVGHSGAGKSTMAMLINRFYDVTKGAITVDGIDLRSIDVHGWRNAVGLVLQENIMFNDSVLENIRYGRPEATEEEVIDAAKRASAHDFITKLAEGYRTTIGERGIRLSGGERQRVAIARAILKNPSIVVLDEATSALDSKTEKDVQEGIRELIKGKTSFIIAHRLSTVRSVDRIAVLEKGKIIACAPHEELLRTCDVYREMVELQSGGMLAE